MNIWSFNKLLLTNHDVSGVVLGTGATEFKKIYNSCPPRAGLESNLFFREREKCRSVANVNSKR